MLRDVCVHEDSYRPFGGGLDVGVDVFSASIVNTIREDKTNCNHAEPSGVIDGAGMHVREMTTSGMEPEVVCGVIDQMTTASKVMLATNRIMFYAGCVSDCRFCRAATPS